MIIILNSGCGKEGDLIIPPEYIPAKVNNILAEARGGKVYLMWEIPETNIDGSELEDLYQFEIRRFVKKEIQEEDNPVENESYVSKYWKMIKNSLKFKNSQKDEGYDLIIIDYEDIPESFRKAGIGYFEDNGIELKNKGEWFGNKYVYTIQAINTRKKKSELPQTGGSTQVNIAPEPPRNLEAEPHDLSVVLKWEFTDIDIEGNELQEEVSYYIYRSESSSVYLQPPLNETPQVENSYIDESVENYRDYYYIVRALIGEDNLSDNSIEVKIQPFDDSIPNPPINLKAIPVKEGILLIWDKSDDHDVIGYNVYRRAKLEQEFKKINTKPLAKPSFTDLFIYKKITYIYYVTSVDDAKIPNESGPSVIFEVEPLNISR